MTTLKHALCLMMVTASVTAFAQSKGEMPFSASSEINKSLRKSWIALADFNIEEANSNTRNILSQDPACGIAYVSLFPASADEQMENVRKAEGARLSADEKLFVEGLKARLAKQSTQTYFEPLLKKYPKDTYLQLWVMFNYGDPERSIEIGEGLIRRNAKFAPAYNLLGYLYMDRNDMAKAETYFDKYIALRPDLANVYDSKGDFLMRASRYEEAIPLFEKAASMGMTLSGGKAEHARALLRYPKPSDVEIEKIRNILSASFDAFEKNNVDEGLQAYSDQSVEIMGNQITNVGMPNIRQRVKAMLKNGAFIKEDFKLVSVNGTGPIVIAYGKTESVWKSASSGKETERHDHAIFLLRREKLDAWKILADHFYPGNADDEALSPEDLSDVHDILNKWSKTLEAGEGLTDEHMERLSALYSPQAIEIFPSQRSNVGIANLRARWANFVGAKFEQNALEPIGVEGLGRRAVAWGIGTQAFYAKDSKELVKDEFPWAMIFTKEKDDVWRILAIHWGE